MDEIIIEKQKGELTEVVLELNQNTLITELKNLEVTPTSQEQTFKAGVGAFKEVKIKGDENLISENIKSGETIFGVEGNKNVVDTSDATATSSKIHPDCDAYVKGKKIKGGMTIWDNTKPRCTPTHQTIINPENPFILTRQQTTGERYEEIIKIPANVIDPTWLEGKNICIRANYNPNLTHWSKDWRIEIATVNDGGKFFFKVYSGGYMEIWARNAANKTTNYTLYTANVDSIDELTIDSWKKKEVVADGYTNGDLGPIGTLYAYGRDDCGKTTGLTGSSGVPGSRNKFILKSANSKTGYTEANAEFYSEITHSDLAKKIKLKAEDIKEGKTYLDITGTMPNNNANLEIVEESLDFSTDRSLPQLTLTTIDFTGMDLSKVKHWHYAFWNYKKLKEVKGIDFVNPNTSAYWMFCGCDSLEIFPEMKNTQNVVDFARAFQECKKLKTIEYFDTSNANDLSYMCIGCSELVNFPALNASKTRIGGLSDMFSNCPNLSDESLNNILAMCISANATHANAAYGNKSLTQYLKLTSTQANKCKSLSNWSAFIAAGWTA